MGQGLHGDKGAAVAWVPTNQYPGVGRWTQRFRSREQPGGTLGRRRHLSQNQNDKKPALSAERCGQVAGVQSAIPLTYTLGGFSPFSSVFWSVRLTKGKCLHLVIVCFPDMDVFLIATGF